MKQRMQNSYEKGLAIRSAPSLALIELLLQSEISCQLANLTNATNVDGEAVRSRPLAKNRDIAH
jgi:hypothetical protein